MKKCGAIILAAGKGTRMKSEKAKVTFPLAGKPLIQRVVDSALDVNCDLLAVVVGYQKEDVISCIAPHSKLVFVEQKLQKGTGHAVKVAEDKFRDFDGDILILCGDVPLLSKETLERLRLVHNKEGAGCTVLTVKLDNPGTYGRIIRDVDGSVQRIVEYKDAGENERLIKEINSGIYCFNRHALFDALSKIKADNKQQEYYLTDTLEILKSEGKKVSAVVTDKIHEVSGINSQKQLASLEKQLYRKVKDYWLHNGVNIENPDSVIIGEDVELCGDVSIGANSIIKGKSKVGRLSKIGPFAYLNDAVIKEDVIIEGFNVIINASIEKNDRIRWGEKRYNE